MGIDRERGLCYLKNTNISIIKIQERAKRESERRIQEWTERRVYRERYMRDIERLFLCAGVKSFQKTVGREKWGEAENTGRRKLTEYIQKHPEDSKKKEVEMGTEWV